MSTPHRPQRLATLICFALLLGIASCYSSSSNVYCYSSSCTDSVYFYASGTSDSKTITVRLPGGGSAYVRVYVSDNEQEFDLALSSSLTIVDSYVDVNSRQLLAPGYATSWTGTMFLPQYSSSAVNRYIGYRLRNYDSYVTTSVTITLTVTRFESYSNAATAISLIVIIVPIIISLLTVASVGAVCVRRIRRRKLRQQQTSVVTPFETVRPLDPIATSPQPMYTPQPVQDPYLQPQQMSYMQNNQYFSNYSQVPNQGYNQGYTQGYDQVGQSVYYMPQNQGPAMQFVVQG